MRRSHRRVGLELTYAGQFLGLSRNKVTVGEPAVGEVEDWRPHLPCRDLGRDGA